MNSDTQYQLSLYKDIAELSDKGNVKLVRHDISGKFFVKKHLDCYHPDVYHRLQKNPIQNLPEIIEIFQLETELIVIEEYLPGSTLAELLTHKSTFSEKETLDIAKQLCLILIQLHAFTPPIIHRDIKPSNVLLTPDGILKLLDFNAAKPEDSGKTRDTTLIGTAGHAAPEQYGFAPSSPQTDIYALGVLMNICLTGKLPTAEMATGKLKSIIRRCLEINPKDRYSNVKELYRALSRLTRFGREWFLPGFRTLKIHKMLLATVGYGFLIYGFFQDILEDYQNLFELYMYRFAFLFIGLFLIFFYSNYLNIQRFFPFMKSAKKGLRILGMVLAPFLIFWTIIILVAVLDMIFL